MPDEALLVATGSYWHLPSPREQNVLLLPLDKESKPRSILRLRKKQERHAYKSHIRGSHAPTCARDQSAAKRGALPAAKGNSRAGLPKNC